MWVCTKRHLSVQLNRKVGGSSLPRDSYLAIQKPIFIGFDQEAYAYTRGESVVGKKDVKIFSWRNGLIFLNRK